ncbi:OmpH family outer membrane protein [bacterium]|nr:OmpH family outer membrane protein [bacterium]RQV99148.1 MAG: OmpH family outer membrane protein [bacterium]
MFRKKYMICGMVPVLIFGFWGSGKLHAQAKIGYVDSERILTSYTSAIDARRQLDARNDEWDKELQQMNNELNALQEELDQKSLLLSEAKKTEITQEIESKVLAIQQYQTDKWGERGQYFTYRDTLLKPIYDRINEAIRTVADEEGYDFVLDSAEGNILFAKTQYDITDWVLEELERGASEEEMYYE